jgi:hypothetical protein
VSLALSFCEVFAAWLLIDLATGIYHLMTDRGWNFASQVAMFREHHDTNTMLGFDWQPMVAGVPVMILGGWYLSSFWLAVGSFAVLAQVPHYYAHVPNPPRLVRWLQKVGLAISPEHHAGHHGGEFDTNFCIFTGWADYLLNPVVKLLPHAAPAENLPSGKTGSLLPGAASSNPARVAAAGTANRQNSAGRSEAGEE